MSEISAEIPTHEQLEIIEKHFYMEAAVAAESKETLQTSLDMEERTQALGKRVLALERIECLLNAWLDISQGEAVY